MKKALFALFSSLFIAGNAAAFEINGSLNVLGSSLTVSGSTFTVANGNVGIGTTSPAQNLEVNGNAQIDSQLMANGTGNYSISASSGIHSAGTVQASTFSGSGFYLNNIQVSGVNGLQTSLSNIASSTSSLQSQISSISTSAVLNANNTWGGVNTWSSSATYVNSNFSVGGSSLVVSAGNVGVGTSLPVETLDVNGSFGIGSNVFGTLINPSQTQFYFGQLNHASQYGTPFLFDNGDSNPIPTLSYTFGGGGVVQFAEAPSTLYGVVGPAVVGQLGMSTIFDNSGPQGGFVAINPVTSAFPPVDIGINGNGAPLSSDAVIVVSSVSYVGIDTSTPHEPLEVDGTTQVDGTIQNNGLINLGGLTDTQLQDTGCPQFQQNVSLCEAINLTDFDLYTSTGASAGSWRNTRTGVAP